MLAELIIKRLKEKNLLGKAVDESVLSDIKSIGCDSRSVTVGQMFFVKGVNFKKEYLYEAVRCGAACYVAEKDCEISLPYINVKSVRAAMPVVADLFYGSPYSAYNTFGVTGTKGKTTTVYMLKNIFALEYGEGGVGAITTNEALCGNRSIEKSGTTPEALELYSILDEFRQGGVKACCMEVSSQGLQYNRVDCMRFFAGAFLNLSPDHQSPNEHHSFEEYKAAKKKLFSMCKYGIFNLDDEYADEFIKESRCEKVVTFAIEKNADYKAENIVLSRRGSTFTVAGEEYELNIAGKFNIYNALCAIACARAAGCKEENIKEGLRRTAISGRMEIYEKKGVTVIVDYAHNKLSFESVFGYVKSCYPEAKTICVFGCPGNKAYDRRVENPEVIGKNADFAVITTDDPENEKPEEIIEEVEKELRKTSVKFVSIEDREAAVSFAIEKAQSGDVVILAGKGHETTQKVAGHLEFYKGDMAAAIDELDKKFEIGSDKE